MTAVATIILGNAVVIPVDGSRRILDRGHVVVSDGLIITVAEGRWPEPFPAEAERLDCEGAILIPA